LRPIAIIAHGARVAALEAWEMGDGCHGLVFAAAPPWMAIATFAHDAESDETLAEQARHGSRAAFGVLVERYQGRVYRLGMRMTHNRWDSEEIAQETFLRAHRSIAFFRGESRFGTWLYRIALNEALMRRRAAARRPTQSIEDLLPHLPETMHGRVGSEPEYVDALVARRQLVDRVHAALASLDDAHKAALVLRDLEELSAEDAAEVLGVSADVVRQRAHRARLKLRELLRDDARSTTD
jgi:RNA polymerase sigma-70 factor (ECF subfamily)